MTSVEIRAAIQAEHDAMKALVEAAKGETRSLSPDEQTDFDTREATIEGLEAELPKVEKYEERERKLALAAPAPTPGPGEPKVDVVSEPRTYERGAPNGYFRDLVRMNPAFGFDADKQVESRERIRRHGKEVQVDAAQLSRDGKLPQEYRDITRTDTTSVGEFVPPLWLIGEYGRFLRAARVTADLCTSLSLPGGTDSINIPRLTTGTAVAAQTADNAAVQETDAVSGTVTAPVRTIAGQEDIAIQVLDQSPIAFDEVIFMDLAADYASKLDIQVLNGSGSNGQVQGINGLSGIKSVAYTDASPTVPELYPILSQAVSQVAGARFLPPTAIVMHPRRWFWMTSILDSTGRPLVTPSISGPFNATAVEQAVESQGPVGNLVGLPVYLDPNVPVLLTNGAGAAGTEDVIFVARFSDALLFEGTPRTRTLPEVLSGTLTVRLQLYNYVAFTAGRYPVGFGRVYDTGLAAPSGF